MNLNPPPTPLSSKTRSKLRRERAKRRAAQYAQETGTHEEILNAYLLKNKIAGALPVLQDSTSRHEQTAQTTEHPAPHSGNPPATPHTTDRGVKRTSSSTPNKGVPSKTFKPDNPVLNIFRKDRNTFIRGDRACVSKILMREQMSHHETPDLTRTGKTRVAGSCLVMEVFPSSLKHIKEAINSCEEAYFATEVDEVVHLHSLKGSVPLALREEIYNLPTYLAISSGGMVEASDFNCTRKTIDLSNRIGFWIQVTTKALEWIVSKDCLVWAAGEPLKLKLERSLYIPSRAEQSPALIEESDPEDMEQDNYQLEQLELHSGRQSTPPLNTSFEELSLRSRKDKQTPL